MNREQGTRYEGKYIEEAEKIRRKRNEEKSNRNQGRKPKVAS